jgi:uncharacterized protein YggT (Ycf19 family)
MNLGADPLTKKVPPLAGIALRVGDLSYQVAYLVLLFLANLQSTLQMEQ